MSAPQRIRLSRRKGWEMPLCARMVSRPSRFGNPFRSGKHPAHITPEDRTHCARTFEVWLHRAAQSELRAEVRRELAGWDLACWCPLDGACHADALLALANEPPAIVLVDALHLIAEPLRIVREVWPHPRPPAPRPVPASGPASDLPVEYGHAPGWAWRVLDRDDASLGWAASRGSALDLARLILERRHELDAGAEPPSETCARAAAGLDAWGASGVDESEEARHG